MNVGAAAAGLTCRKSSKLTADDDPPKMEGGSEDGQGFAERAHSIYA